MTRALAAPPVLLLACLLLACGAPGQNVVVALPSAARPLPPSLVARDVGALLSADPRASEAALARLTALDEEGRAALLAHALSIPSERDPRWLLVLDENRALVPLGKDREVDYLLWKAARPESFYVAKAQDRLHELALTDPDVLAARLARGGSGVEALAVALAQAGDVRAVAPLLAAYRAAPGERQRAALSEALGLVLPPDLKPRAQGPADQIAGDAEAVDRWLRARAQGGGRG